MASSVSAAEAGKARRRRKNQKSGARIFIKYQPMNAADLLFCTGAIFT
jgi:hypothetical protein